MTTYADISLYADVIDPFDINKRLYVEADEFIEKGALTGLKQAITSSRWGVTSQEVMQSNCIEDHIDYLLGKCFFNKLQKTFLREFLSNKRSFARLFIFHSEDNTNAILYIDELRVNSIANLGLELGFDFWRNYPINNNAIASKNNCYAILKIYGEQLNPDFISEQLNINTKRVRLLNEKNIATQQPFKNALWLYSSKDHVQSNALMAHIEHLFEKCFNAKNIDFLRGLFDKSIYIELMLFDEYDSINFHIFLSPKKIETLALINASISVTGWYSDNPDGTLPAIFL